MLVHLIISLAATGFILMGISGIYKEWIKPLRRSKEAIHWDQVNCSIISSELKELRGRGTSYWPKIVYNYEYKGEKYESDQYSFWIICTRSKRIPKAVVAHYNDVMSTTCFVNPLNPGEAVLSRETKLPIVSILANSFFITIAATVIICEIYRLIMFLQ